MLVFDKSEGNTKIDTNSEKKEEFGRKGSKVRNISFFNFWVDHRSGLFKCAGKWIEDGALKNLKTFAI